MKEHSPLEAVIGTQNVYLLRDFPTRADSHDTLMPYTFGETVYGSREFNVLDAIRRDHKLSSILGVHINGEVDKQDFVKQLK